MPEGGVMLTWAALIWSAIGFCAGAVSGYAVGRQVQRRREEGMSTSQAIDDTKAKIKAAAKARYDAAIAEAKKAAEDLNG